MVDTSGRGMAWRIGDGEMGGRSKVVWAALMSHRLLDLVVPVVDDLGHEVAFPSFEKTGVCPHPKHEVLVFCLSVRESKIDASLTVVEK